MSGNSVVLSAYDAKRCARRVHNDHEPTLSLPAWIPPVELQARLDSGVAFASGRP